MKRQIFKPNLISLVLVSIGVALSCIFVASAANENPEPQVAPERPKIEFAPGQLIVKLKEGKSLEELAELRDKYRISSAGQLVQNNSGYEGLLNQLKGKLSELSEKHESWYWQLNKNSQEYKDYLAKLEKDKGALVDKIKETEALREKEKQFEKENPQGLTQPNLKDLYLLKSKDSKADISAMVYDFSRSPNVEYAEPNYAVKVNADLPNDYQNYGGSWALNKIEADKAWDLSQGEGVIVAVIDTGVDYNHPDLKDNMWKDKDSYGYNFVDGNNNPMDKYGHGTEVAGVIAAVGNNNIGIIGVAPRAKIMAIKALDNKGKGYISDLVQAVRYAVDKGAKVINASWGTAVESQALTDAFHDAYLRGCVSIATAGNSGMDTKYHSPANIDTVIAVAASDEKDRRCNFSNYGQKVDLASPGENILSTKLGGEYGRSSGTSVAAPYVSGVTALILSKKPELTADEVRYALQMSVDPLPKDSVAYGSGRVNAYKACGFDPLDYKLGLTSIKDKQILQGNEIEIKGSASLGKEFKKYELSYSPKDQYKKLPSGVIKTSTYPKKDDLLGVWNIDPKKLPGGKYILTLKAVTKEGEELTRSKEVSVDAVSPFNWRSNQAALINSDLSFKFKVATENDNPDLSYYYYTEDGALSGNSQTFSWQPTYGGSYNVIFKAEDSSGATVEQQLGVTAAATTEYSIPTTGALSNLAYDQNKISWNDSQGKIHIYDFATKSEIADPYLPTATNLDISGNRIIYSRVVNSGEASSVCLYDVAAQGEYQMTYDWWMPKNSRSGFKLSGDNLVFTWRASNGVTNIRYKKATNAQSPANGNPITNSTTTSEPSYISPAVSGNKVVFFSVATSATGWMSNLYLYDLANTSAGVTVLFPGLESANDLGIDGENIVWTSYTGSQKHLYLYNLGTYELKELGAGDIDSDQSWGAQIVSSSVTINQGQVAWLSGGSSNFSSSTNWYYFHLYDIAKDRELTFAKNYPGKNISGLVVSNNKLVWFVHDLDGNYHPTNTRLNVAQLYFQPIVSSVSPNSAIWGDTITITGFAFGDSANSQVLFDNFSYRIPPANIISWTDTQIRCRLPTGAENDRWTDNDLNPVTTGPDGDWVIVSVHNPAWAHEYNTVRMQIHPPLVDNIAPVTQYNFTQASPNSNVSVGLTPTDASSGVDKLYYKHYKSGESEPGWSESSGSAAVNFTILFSDKGNHIIKYYAVDKKGNAEAQQIKQVVISALTITGPDRPDGSGGSHLAANSTAVTVSIDDQGSGASQMRISNNSSFSGSAWETYVASKAWTLPSGEGSKTVYAQLKDNAGSVSPTMSASVTLDIKNPYCGDFYLIGHEVTPGVMDSPEISFIIPAVDDFGSVTGSGVVKMRLCNGSYTARSCSVDNNWQAFNAGSINWTLPGPDGPKWVWVELMDEAGNSVIAKSLGTQLVTNTPSGTVQINSGAQFTNATRVNLTLTLTSTGDSYSAQVFISNTAGVFGTDPDILLGDNSPTTKEWDLTSGDGTKIVYVRFQNLAGGYTETSSSIVLATASSITATMSINGGAQYTNSSSGEVNLALNADSPAGISEMRFSNSQFSTANNPPWEDYNTSKLWTLSAGDGEKKVYAQFKSTGSVKSIDGSIYLDRRKPQTVFAFDEGRNPIKENGWYNRQNTFVNFGFVLTPQDYLMDGVVGGSGIKETKYCLDGSYSPTLTYTGRVDINADGIYNINYYSTDQADNYETALLRPVEVKIDRTAPVTTDTIVEGRVYNDTDTISFNISDPASGVKETTYYIAKNPKDSAHPADNEFGGAQQYTAPIGFSGRGVYVLKYFSVDNAGNTEDHKISKPIMIGSGTTNAPVFDPIGDQSATLGQSLTFTVHAVDADNDTVTYSSSNLPAGATLDRDTGVFVWPQPQWKTDPYQVNFVASDGNGRTAAKVVKITVRDSNPPTITLLNDSGPRINSSNQLRVHFTASAPTSGIASWEYEVTPHARYEGADRIILAKRSQTEPVGTMNIDYNFTDDINNLAYEPATYYYHLKVKSGSGEEAVASSPGVSFNHAPRVPAAAVSFQVNKNNALKIRLPLDPNDSDGEDDISRYTIIRQPEHSADPSYPLYPLDGNKFSEWQFTPERDFAGDVSFTYKATDKAGLDSNVGTVNIQVVAHNNPPDLKFIPDTLIKNEGQVITKDEIERAIDLDDPFGRGLEYIYSEWFNSALPYTIGYDQVGRHKLHVKVRDSAGASAEKDVWVTVNNAVKPPDFISGDGSIITRTSDTIETSEGAVLPTYTLPTVRNYGSGLTYAFSGDLPSGLNRNNNQITGTLTARSAGVYLVRWIATDSEGSNTFDLTINVAHVNHPPVAFGGVFPGAGMASYMENSPNPLVIRLDNCVGDADKDPIDHYVILSKPKHGKLNPDPVIGQSTKVATYQYTPNKDYNCLDVKTPETVSGFDFLTFTANDGKSESAPGHVEMRVDPIFKIYKDRCVITGTSIELHYGPLESIVATGITGNFSYDIYRDNSLIANVATYGTLLYLDTGLVPNHTYNYQVRVRNTQGISCSTLSLGLKTMTVPDPGSGLTVTLISPADAPRYVRLTWRDNLNPPIDVNETGFNIFRHEEWMVYNGSGQGYMTTAETSIPVASNNGPVASYEDHRPLLPGHNYSYTVYSKPSFESPGWSRTIDIPSIFGGVDLTVTLISPADAPRYVRLTWRDNLNPPIDVNETGFNIFRHEEWMVYNGSGQGYMTTAETSIPIASNNGPVASYEDHRPLLPGHNYSYIVYSKPSFESSGWSRIDIPSIFGKAESVVAPQTVSKPVVEQVKPVDYKPSVYLATPQSFTNATAAQSMPAPALSQAKAPEAKLAPPVTQEPKPQSLPQSKEEKLKPQAPAKQEDKKAPVEPPAKPAAPSINYMATYSDDGQMKEVQILNEKAESLHSYEIQQNPAKSLVTLVRDDQSKVYLSIDKNKQEVKQIKIKQAKGISAKEVEKEVKDVISFIGYKLKK